MDGYPLSLTLSLSLYTLCEKDVIIKSSFINLSAFCLFLRKFHFQLFARGGMGLKSANQPKR